MALSTSSLTDVAITSWISCPSIGMNLRVAQQINQLINLRAIMPQVQMSMSIAFGCATLLATSLSAMVALQEQ